MKKISALLLAMLLCFSLVSLAACNGSTTTSPEVSADVSNSVAPVVSEEPDVSVIVPPSGEPILVGHIVDLDGQEALTGNVAKESFDFAIKSINENGGIAGRPVQVVTKNASNDAGIALEMAKELVEKDNVIAIFGPTQIQEKNTVAPYMLDAKIPLIFYNPSPLALFNDNPWIVGYGGSAPQLPSVMANYAYNELKWEKIYTAKKDRGGDTYMIPFIEAFKALGGTVIDEKVLASNAGDYSALLTSCNDATANGLVAWTSSADALALWQNWYDLGLTTKLPILAPFHGGFTDYYIAEEIASSSAKTAAAMLGTKTPLAYCYSIDTPENAAFVAAYEKEFGHVPLGNNLPGDTYSALLTLKTAIEANNGKTDADSLIKAIFAVDFVAPSGRVVFENGAQAATKSVYVCELEKQGDSYNYKVVKTYDNVPITGLAK